MALFERKKATQENKSDDGEINSLINLLSSKNWEERGNAAVRLSEIGLPAVVELLKALDSENSLIQTGAAEVLGTFGEAALPTLLKVVFFGKERARDGAARAVGQNGAAAIPQLVEAMANTENASVRSGAALCMGYMGYMSQMVEGMLVDALRDSDSGVRIQAAKSLENINWTPKNKTQRAQYFLAKGDYNSLAKLGKDALPAIQSEVLYGSSETKKKIADILPKIAAEESLYVLVKLIEDKDAQVRQKTVAAMSDASDRRLIPYIINALDDEDSYVRMEAAWSLDRKGWKPSTNDEKAKYLMIKEKWTELLQMRDAAVPILIASLKDKNPGIRLKSTEVLRAMGNVGYSAINEALKSEDPALRAGAAEAVAVIKKKNAAAAKAQSDKKKAQTPDEEVEEQLKRHNEAMKARNGNSKTEEQWAKIMRKNGLDEDRIARFSKALSDENEIMRAAAVENLKATGNCGIECMIILLADPKNNVRIAAIESLGDLKAKRAAKYLVKLIKDKNENVRMACVHSLGLMHDPETLGSIVGRLFDPNAAVRNKAVETVAKFGSEALPHLKDHLAIQDMAVRIIAIRTISKISHPDSIALCIRMLNDTEYDVRQCAEAALLALADTQFNNFVDYAFKISKRGKTLEKTGIIAVLSQIKDTRAKQAIAFYLQDSDEKVVNYAKKCLQGDSSEEFTPELLKSLEEQARALEKKTKSAQTKKDAAAGSAATAPAQAPPSAQGHQAQAPSKAKTKESEKADTAGEMPAQHSETAETAPVSESVAAPEPAVEEPEEPEEPELTPEEEAAAVARDLKSTDSAVQMKAAEKVFMMGDVIIPPLIEALNDENPETRTFIAEILLGLGDTAIQGLVKALENPEPSIRMTAAQSLGKIPDDVTITALCGVLEKDNNSHVRTVAAESLGFMGDKRALNPLIAASKENDKALKSAALRSLGYINDEQAIPTLIETLKNADPDIVTIATAALTQYGYEATKALEHALMTEKGSAREKITYALDELGWVPENEEAISYYFIARKQWAELEDIGEAAIPALQSAIADSSIEVKISAMNTIANIGGEQAAAALENIVNTSTDATEKTLAKTMLTKVKK